MVEVALRSIRHQCASLVSMGRSAVGDQVEHVPYLTYLIVFLCTAGLFGAYEGIKEAIFHGALSPWESHLATIFVAGLLSTAACEVLRKRSLELIAETSAAQARDFAFQQSFLQTLPLAVFYKDRNGRYLGCNHKFSEITGFSADMILGKTVYELWPGELAEMYHQKDLDLMARPEHQVYEFKIKDKDGVDLDVIYSKAVFCDERGVVAGIIGTFLDISDKVELINQMAATQVELQ